jgi:uncharacterized protein (TIGR04255 family)
MADWPRFPNAPINEALLDIRAKLPPEVDLPQLATFQEGIRERYPDRSERSTWQAGLELKPTGDVKVHPPIGGPNGYLFKGPDGRRLVQARLDGFTFNWLKPYDTWQTFRDEAKELWKRYLDIATPLGVSRIALRYINQLNIPLPMKDFKDYIRTTPEIAPGLPQGLQNFFMRLEIPDADSGRVTIVTQTMAPPKEDSLPLIFDIDVIHEQAFDARSPEIWEAFEQLRDLKNRIFFLSITDKAQDLFK